MITSLPVTDLASDDRSAMNALAPRLTEIAAGTPLILCGYAACVDVRLPLERILPPLLASDERQAKGLGAALAERARLGADSEMLWDWPAGPETLDQYGDGSVILGGTSAQAARMLALLGGHALLALADRSPRQLGALHPDILLAHEGSAVRADTLAPTGDGKPAHYIIEFTADRAAGGVVPARSGRIILRFADDGLERDLAFADLSRALAKDAGAAVLSGFNGIPPRDFAEIMAWAADLAKDWRRAGLGLLHLEMADFPSPEARAPMLAALRPAVTSVGLSLGEIDQVVPGDEPTPAKMRALADVHKLDRVCVHADRWAMSLTRNNPADELTALRAGCLLAATRAAQGDMSVPRSTPYGAVFTRPPWPSGPCDPPWYLVSCSSPYLKHPSSTLGLGDTFLAGTMLVLAGSYSRCQTASFPQPR